MAASTTGMTISSWNSGLKFAHFVTTSIRNLGNLSLSFARTIIRTSTGLGNWLLRWVWKTEIICDAKNNGHVCLVQMYQAESFPLNSWLTRSRYEVQKSSSKKSRKDVESSEDESNEDMVFISPKHASSKINGMCTLYDINRSMLLTIRDMYVMWCNFNNSNIVRFILKPKYW